MLIARIFTNLLGVFIFLFIFWKKMKEDFSNEIIFRSGSYIITGITIFYLFSFNFSPNWFLWSEMLGASLGLALAIYSQRIKFFESLEAMVLSILPWISLLFLSDSIYNSSFSSFSAFVVILILMFVSYWLDENYKSFNWYKSGKIGLSGLLVLGLFFLIRSVVAFSKITVVSFVGSWDLVLSLALYLVSLFLVYYLAKYEK